MSFLYMDDFQYDRETKTLRHLPTNKIYSDYVGVSRIVNFGLPTFFEKLVATHGKEKAKEIQANSVARGNSIHKTISKNPKARLPQLGTPLAYEVFVFYQLLPGCPPVQGSIDCIYQDFFGKFHLIEYKSKSSRRKWERWKHDSIEQNYKQVAMYKYLVEFQYGIKLESCNLCIVFPNEPCLNIQIKPEMIDYQYNICMNNLMALKRG